MLDCPNLPLISEKKPLLLFYCLCGVSLFFVVPQNSQDYKEMHHCFCLQAAVTKAITVLYDLMPKHG